MSAQITIQSPIEPLKEMVSYEAIWGRELPISYKRIADLFESRPGSRPSDFVSREEYAAMSDFVKDKVLGDLYRKKIDFNLLFRGTFDYPQRLLDAKETVTVLYYSGNIDLLQTRSVAVVGTRNPTPEGERRAFQIARDLVKDGFTIVSGLAKGIDTIAHKTAIKLDGRTIAVIGTPLNIAYPKENGKLQSFIAHSHLLISQVPFYKHSVQGAHGNRLFFPERNKTMSALTEATIIVEASETSGTLVQARAALQQGRKLFILDSCFSNPLITWPERFVKQGAIRAKSYSDIISVLGK